jgi:hypothetical protein
MSDINGDDIKVQHGDKVITLQEQLAGMSKAIRRLEIAAIIIIVLTILNAILTDESMTLLINQVLDLFGG